MEDLTKALVGKQYPLINLTPAQLSAVRREKNRPSFGDDDACTHLIKELAKNSLQFKYEYNPRTQSECIKVYNEAGNHQYF